MSKWLALVIAGFLSFPAYSNEEYKIIVPNPPGIGTDAVARKLSEIYNRNTGNKLIVTNLPGGNHIIAAQAAKKEKRPTAVIGTTTMHVYNYFMIKDLPYNDSDFRHIIYFGDQPGFFITKPDGPIKSVDDIKNLLPNTNKPLVGTHASQGQLNVFSINTRTSKPLEAVNYKSPQEVATAVMAGDLDIGVMSLGGSSALELVRAGRLRVVASTLDYDTKLDNFMVPSLSKRIGAPLFNGSAILSTNNVNTPEADKLARDLLTAASSAEMMEFLHKTLIFHVKYDYSKTREMLESQRADIRKQEKWFLDAQSRTK